MSTNLRYTIVKADSVVELTRKVQENLDQGWNLVGGVSTAYNSGFGQVYYIQAMTSYV